MRIAFDLDGVLVPVPGSPMLTEELPLLSRAISQESIRAGAPILLSRLRQQGHEVWLYTTSLRRPWILRVWFASFGVRVDGIVNKAIHDARTRQLAITRSELSSALRHGC